LVKRAKQKKNFSRISTEINVEEEYNIVGQENNLKPREAERK